METKEQIETSITKLLNRALPKEFTFIDRVEGVNYRDSNTFLSSLRVSIVLNYDWILKNCDELLLEYIESEIKNYGHCILGNFSLEEHSKTNTDDIVNYVRNICKFLGFNFDNWQQLHIVYVVKNYFLDNLRK